MNLLSPWAFKRRPLAASILYWLSCSLGIFFTGAPPVRALQGFGTDERTPMLSSAYPWSAIGRVEINEGGHCTGALVGVDLVLTNAHCIFSSDGRLVGASFLPNYKRGFSSERIRGTAYFYATRLFNQYRSDDWAVIRLEKPIGQKYGWLGIKPLNLSRGMKVTYVGYSSFDGETVAEFVGGRTAQIHEGCTIRDFYPEAAVIHTDCDNGTGGSGGPLIVWADGNPFIVAINAADYRDAPEYQLRRPPGGGSFFTSNYRPGLGNVGVLAGRFEGTVARLTSERARVERDYNNSTADMKQAFTDYFRACGGNENWDNFLRTRWIYFTGKWRELGQRPRCAHG